MLYQSRRVVAVALLYLALQACAVQRSVALSPATAERHLSIGDEVVVVLKTGKIYRAIVVEVTDAALVSEHRRYTWDEIKYITHKEEEPVLSILATIGAALAAGVLAFALMF